MPLTYKSNDNCVLSSIKTESKNCQSAPHLQKQSLQCGNCKRQEYLCGTIQWCRHNIESCEKTLGNSRGCWSVSSTAGQTSEMQHLFDKMWK